MSMSLLLSAAECVECRSLSAARRIPISFLVSHPGPHPEPCKTSSDTSPPDGRTASPARRRLSPSPSLTSLDSGLACSHLGNPTSEQLVPSLPSTQTCHSTASSHATLDSFPPTSPSTPPPREQPRRPLPLKQTNSAIQKNDRPNSAGPSGFSSSTTAVAPRRRWNAREDALLTAIVSACGAARWNEIATRFPGRNGRQVRLRWMNHLQPSLDRAPWRAEEDEMLLRGQRALGNRWSAIAARLGGRTDNSVKNRFKSLQRKAAREERANVAARLVAMQRGCC